MRPGPGPGAAPRIRPATPRDRPQVIELLTAASLPTAGLPMSLAGFVVAEDGGRIAGAAGLETYGRAGLLRSVVVAPALRGAGVGHALTERVLQEAAAQGLADLYLLTTTAERYFPRHGFARIGREEVPERVQASVEFQGACPSTAVVMHRQVRR
jgi:amino-acid N-acetyltransferase